jgi:hypothetical protein
MVDGAIEETAWNVSHQTYEELAPFESEEMDAILSETLSNSRAETELWTCQYEAVNALR